MTFVEDTLVFWVKLGLLDVVLPFILIFTILFALLQRVQVLGKHNSRVNALVAFSISFITIAISSITDVLTKFAQLSALALLVFVLVVITLSFVGAKLKQSKFLLYSASATIFLIAITALGWWKFVDLSFINRNLLMPLIMLIFFFFVIWFITKDRGETITSAVDNITKASKTPSTKPAKSKSDKSTKKSKSANKPTGPVSPDDTSEFEGDLEEVGRYKPEDFKKGVR